MPGVSAVHTLCAVVANTTVIGGITAQRLGVGSDVRATPTSGEAEPRFVSLYRQAPVGGFTTLNVAAALNAFGATSPYSKSIADLAAGLIFYAQKMAEGATRSAGATHRKYTMKEGIVLPRMISATHGGDATINYDTILSWDGTNDPIAETDSVALPESITDAERFTLYTSTLEDIELSQLRGIDISFGIMAQSDGSESEIWDRHAHIATVAPVITFRGVNVAWLADTAIPLLGLAVTHANTSIYLRKRALGGTFEEDATAEHIKITAAGMATVQNAFDATGNALGTCDVVLTTYNDNTNDPLVIDTTSAIT